MDRVYESGAVAGAPAAPAAPSTGYPTNGNPAGGIEATWPGAYWFHMITEELRAVITAAGLVPDHTNLGQLLAALQGGFGLGSLDAESGYIELPGGWYLQGGTTGGVATGSIVTFPLAFPTRCVAVNAFMIYGGSFNIVMTGSISQSQFTINHNYAGTADHRWFALGY